jgi:hypothetical protein
MLHQQIIKAIAGAGPDDRKASYCLHCRTSTKTVDQSELFGTMMLQQNKFRYFFPPYFFLEKKVTKIQGFIKFFRKSFGSLSRRSDHFPTKGSEKRCVRAQPHSKKSPDTN